MSKDIELDETGDLNIENGDFVISSDEAQSAKTLIDAFAGWFKNNPLTGFGLLKYLKSNVSKSRFKRNLKVQLEADGHQNPEIDLSEGFENMKINIKRK